MDIKEEELWELVEMYMELAEKQDEVIFRLSSMVKRQAIKIEHLKTAYGFFEEDNEVEEEKKLMEEALEEYKDMCEV